MRLHEHKEMLKNLRNSGLADYIKQYIFKGYIATEPWQKEFKKSAMDFVKQVVFYRWTKWRR